MNKEIIGISGSPIPNSNTDRFITHILKSSGQSYEFVKLSDITVRPCRACKACVKDNICKVNDDFPELAKKLLTSKAVVIGGYAPYRMIDGYTKAFIERLWSMRHLHSLNQGRIAVTVVSSIEVSTAQRVLSSLAIVMQMEKFNHVAQFHIGGNVACLTCGVGSVCNVSGARRLFGLDADISKDLCVAVETLPVWEQGGQIGALIGRYINGETETLPSVKF
jgi:multimeric flavodoxin WrbA